MRWIRTWLQLRLFLLILWVFCVWIGYSRFKVRQAGCAALEEKAALMHAVAMRAMPVNWLIGAGDIDWGKVNTHPEFTRKYVTCSLDMSDLVVAGDLRDEPVVVPIGGKLTYLLKLAGLPQNVNAGMHVDIYGTAGGLPIVSNEQVLAVLCKEACFPLLEITPAESAQLQKETLSTVNVSFR
jgi:hypothetical protein